MNGKEIKLKDMTKEEQTALLSLVASQLKDKVLFPRQVEEAKKLLKNAKFKTSDLFQ